MWSIDYQQRRRPSAAAATAEFISNNVTYVEQFRDSRHHFASCVCGLKGSASS